MKKLLSLLLTLGLALTLAVPVSAADDASLGVIGGADGPTAMFITGLTDGAATDGQLAEVQAKLREQAVTFLGGTAGEINVLLNDRCIAFTDAKPEIRDGRTMVPMRAAVEAMGAAVEYDKTTRTATVENGEVRFTHVIDTDTIVLGDGTKVQMDVASCIENGRTMVPVRFFSQVLGYDVFWDKDYRMAFLMDRDALTARIDEQFTVLNACFAKSAKALDSTKNYQEELSLSGTLKVVDSINGDRSYPYTAKAKALVGRAGMRMELSADLGKLLPLFESITGEPFDAACRTLLETPELEVIYGEKTYLRSPLLTALLSESTGAAVDADTWLALESMDYAAFYEALYGAQEDCTMGSLLYAVMEQGDANRFFASWNETTRLADTLAGLLGDKTFTKSGSSYKWHLGLDELAGFLNNAAGVEYYTASDLREEGIRECSVEMTLRANGGVDFSCTIEVGEGEETAFRMSCTMSGDRQKTSVKGSVQMRNICDVTFNGMLTVRTTSEKLVAAPSEGATVVDLSA